MYVFSVLFLSVMFIGFSSRKILAVSILLLISIHPCDCSAQVTETVHLSYNRLRWSLPLSLFSPSFSSCRSLFSNRVFSPYFVLFDSYFYLTRGSLMNRSGPSERTNAPFYGSIHQVRASFATPVIFWLLLRSIIIIHLLRTVSFVKLCPLWHTHTQNIYNTI